MTKREALAQQCVCGEPNSSGTHRTDGPCLAPQPEHEPVAYQDTADKCRLETVPAKDGLLPQRTDEEEYLSKAYRLANELRCHLAIAPAPQRKPLTDEEYSALAEQYTGADGLDCVDYGRAIARHYGIKE